MQNLKDAKFIKFVTILVGLCSVAFLSCEKAGDALNAEKGSININITDAPADNKEVEAVFVTVTNIKVDGESVSAFEGPKTVNVMALQNGKTELLVKEDFRAKTYNSITLELDFDRDEDGNSPGTYVKTANGTKQKLSAEGKAAMAYTFNGTTKVMAKEIIS